MPGQTLAITYSMQLKTAASWMISVQLLCTCIRLTIETDTNGMKCGCFWGRDEKRPSACKTWSWSRLRCRILCLLHYAHAICALGGQLDTLAINGQTDVDTQLLAFRLYDDGGVGLCWRVGTWAHITAHVREKQTPANHVHWLIVVAAFWIVQIVPWWWMHGQ